MVIVVIYCSIIQSRRAFCKVFIDSLLRVFRIPKLLPGGQSLKKLDHTASLAKTLYIDHAGGDILSKIRPPEGRERS